MKYFEEPKVEVVDLNVEDIITTSGNENQLPAV